MNTIDTNGNAENGWEGGAEAHRLFVTVPELLICHLKDNFYVIYSPFLENGPVVLDSSALACLREFEAPQPLGGKVHRKLAECGALVAANANPKKQMEESIAKEEKNRPLNVWISVTNDCNLMCDYCFVHKTSEHMSPATAKAVMDIIFQAAARHKFGSVRIKYSGGEPTLQFETVQALHRYAKQRAAELAVELKAVVLSNGINWTREMANWLLDEGVYLSISLDGVASYHDAQRPMKRGGGSYERISHVIDNILLPCGVRPQISVTITAKNALTVCELVDWAIPRNLLVKLNLLRRNDNVNKKNEYLFADQQVIEGLRKAFQHIELQLPIQTVPLVGLLDSALITHHRFSCDVGQGHFVFNYKGQLTQCPQRLQEGQDIAEGADPLQIISAGPIPIVSVEEKEGCQDCIWRYRCAGGCPVETYSITGRYDVKSPQCTIFKTLLPEVLRLEGLLMLKKAGQLT